MGIWLKSKHINFYLCCLHGLMLLVLGLMPRESLGQSVLTLKDQHIAEPIGQFLGSAVVPDDGTELDTAARNRLVLQPNAKNYFDGGFGEGRIWLQLKILNPHAGNRRIFLEHRDVFVPYVRLLHEASGYAEVATHDSFQGTFKHNYHFPVFEVDVKPGLNTYWIELRGVPKRLKFYLWDEESFLGRGLGEHTMLMVGMALPLVLILYEMLLFLTNPDRLRLIYVSAMASTTASSIISNGIVSFLFPTSFLPWLYTKGIYSTYILASILAPHFTIRLFVPQFPTRLKNIYRGWLVLNGSMLLLIQLVPFQSSFIGIVLLPLAGLGISLAAIIHGIKKRHPQVLYVTCGAAPCILGTFYSISLLFIDFPIVSFHETLLQVELTAFAIGLSMAVGRDIQLRQEAAAQEIEQLNQELRRHVLNIEDIVASKTAKIQSIMTNIKQGIFTIDRRLGLDPEHSAFLEQIFPFSAGHQDDPIDLLYHGTNDRNDESAKLRSALCVILGEDPMAFQLNQDAFPSEIVRQLPQGEMQILECEFSPILDAQGLTDRILVCIRDVTETRKLLLQSATQRETTQILGELISVDPVLFQRCLDQAKEFMKSGRILVAACNPADLKSLQELFISAHTLKGLARSLNLGTMTEVIHLMESELVRLRSKPDPETWSELQNQLAAFQSLLERYQQMSETLHHPAHGALQSQQNRVELGTIFARFSRIPPPNRPTELADYAYVKDSLASLCLVPADGFIDEARSNIKRLASHLQKPEPLFDVQNSGLQLTPEQDVTLRNIFLHLIRNALDHGVESPDVRRGKGKSPVGHIHLKVTEQDGLITLDFGDDGQGLDLERIRLGAVKQCLVPSTARLTREDVAELIFSAGFSTAERIDDISGRGIGMFAVRQMLEALGGRIEIVLDASQGEAAPFHFRIQFPRQFRGQSEQAA